ncbi:MAG: arabinogalactan endo,4-beta-galactosidase [Sphingobacteriales bacterium]|nr:arabinogalactan endo,4-beta-galactosidase [Sphingobacteriales bacterium]
MEIILIQLNNKPNNADRVPNPVSVKYSIMIKNCLLIAVLVLMVSCKKATTPPVIIEPEPPAVTPILSENFVKGADISWLTEMEAANVKFYNSAGTENDLIQILKDKGMNSVRLRVWVNPTDGWNNIADVLAKSLRAKALGMRILIDFHYSDSWADPGKQTKPSAWIGQNIMQLKQSVYDHTVNVLTVLKNNGITPEWVQVGNETNDGMLWEEGRASKNMKNFAELIQSGYTAVKAVSSTSKVMVHISNGYDNGLFRWIFDGLKANGANWDVIGMSLYPSSTNWSTLNTQCLTNMNDMVSRYGKEVMVCEVGMSVTATTECKAFLSDIILKTNSVAGKKGLGVLYWEPQAYNSWKGYNLGAFDTSGKPTAAMDAFMIK